MAPPVLLISTSPDAKTRATEIIESTDYRCIPVAIEDARQRLADQPAATAIWLELDRIDPDVDAALEDIGAAVRRFPTILSTQRDLIEPALALIGDANIDLLADADTVECLASLALATASAGAPARVADVSSEHSTARLRQLSDEVSRIAQTLARLSSATPMSGIDKPLSTAQAETAPAVPGDTVRQLIRARRLRARFFDADLFADPAWDMLLDLFQAEIAQHRVPVSSLCIAAAVPPTTALRWIKTMTDAGLFLRRSDPHDRRRIFVELAPTASDAMRRYFAEVGRSMAA